MNLDRAVELGTAIVDGDIDAWTPDHVDAVRELLAIAELARDAYAPIPRQWAHAQPGDVFVGGDGLWWVNEHNQGGSYGTTVRHGAEGHLVDVQPDDTIPVLVPIAERNAYALLTAHLGATQTEPTRKAS